MIPNDPRLPLSDDIKQLKTRLYDIFRDIANSLNNLEATVSGLSGGGGGGATLNTGTATVDFGAGSNLASVAVTGQTGITSTSSVWLELLAEASGSHTAQDAAYAAMFVHLTATPPSSSSFTIYAVCPDQMSGTFKVRWTWS